MASPARACKVFIDGRDITSLVRSIDIAAGVGSVVTTTLVLMTMPQIKGTSIHFESGQPIIGTMSGCEAIRGITLRDT